MLAPVARHGDSAAAPSDAAVKGVCDLPRSVAVSAVGDALILSTAGQQLLDWTRVRQSLPRPRRLHMALLTAD
jgi:hypothetical protein